MKPANNTTAAMDTDIIFYAFRYALGRKTGAVSYVVDYILNNWDELPQKDKEQMNREIKHAIDMGTAGMDCDIEEWERLQQRYLQDPMQMTSDALNSEQPDSDISPHSANTEDITKDVPIDGGIPCKNPQCYVDTEEHTTDHPHCSQNNPWTHEKSFSHRNKHCKCFQQPDSEAWENVDYFEVETDKDIYDIVDAFTKSETPNLYAHYSDNDENAAQLMRVRLSYLLEKARQEERERACRIVENEKELYDYADDTSVINEYSQRIIKAIHDIKEEKV